MDPYVWQELDPDLSKLWECLTLDLNMEHEGMESADAKTVFRVSALYSNKKKHKYESLIYVQEVVSHFI